MDIEMIKFTGLLSIFLMIGWLLIVVIFIVIGGNMNKTDEERFKDDEEQMKYLSNKRNGEKKVLK